MGARRRADKLKNSGVTAVTHGPPGYRLPEAAKGSTTQLIGGGAALETQGKSGMAKVRRHLVCGAVAAVLLSGCATNALRIEAAADVAQKGRATAAVSSGFLSEVERARYAVNADIIAADPACRDRRATFRQPPQLAAVVDAANPPRGWLCQQLAPGADNRHALLLGPIRRDLAPTFQLIQALADYSSAMTKILEAPAPNPVADIENALETARSAENLLNTLRNDSTTIVPAADDARLTAITGFISFLSELSTEAATVQRLRELRQRTGGGKPIVAALIDHIENWELSRSNCEEYGIQLADTLLTAATREGAPFNAERRRKFAEDYYSRIRAQSSAAQLYQALRLALNGLQQAEIEYDELLNEHPRLTPEQRVRRASIIRQRLTRAFDLATSIILSFRG